MCLLFRNVFVLIEPLEPTLWFAVFLFYIIVSVLLFGVSRAQVQVTEVPNGSQVSLGTSAWAMYGIFLGENTLAIFPKKNSFTMRYVYQ